MTAEILLAISTFRNKISLKKFNKKKKILLNLSQRKSLKKVQLKVNKRSESSS